MNYEFKTYKEFKKIHQEMKQIYPTLTLEERRKLKNYIYSLQMSYGKKDRIWEYLNDDKPEFLLLVLK